MGNIIYISGGSRSGKSLFAENLVMQSEKNKIYIATSLMLDDEMQERIRIHKEQRGDDWVTIETHKDIPLFLEKYLTENNIILLDCLTNLVSNRMFDLSEDWEAITPKEAQDFCNIIKDEVANLIKYIHNSNLELIVVSNELGMGLVPMSPLGRHFRDICGHINQIVAKKAQSAYFIVSGLPIQLK